jgi:hypothetical protein
MGTKNAAMFAALHRDNLNTAKIQTIFEKSKGKQLFYLQSKDTCGFIWICKQLSVILLPLYK